MCLYDLGPLIELIIKCVRLCIYFRVHTSKIKMSYEKSIQIASIEMPSALNS